MSDEHWRFFEALDADVARLARFVEPVPANYATYSIEIARLLLAACAETDVVAKVLCQHDAPSALAGMPKPTMDDCRAAILGVFPNLPEIKVVVPRFSLALKPWSTWSSGVNPDWWQDHQLVKHQRHAHFPKGNLGNCLKATAGLFALVAYLHRSRLTSLLFRGHTFFGLEGGPKTIITGGYRLP